MKISVLTLGCKANQAESSLIEGTLKTLGHHIVDISEKPDFCIVNTCTVTSKSDYQSRQLIRRAGRVGARVIVTGCYSELNREDVKSLEGVTAIIANKDKLSIINELTGQRVDYSLYSPSHNRSRLFIKIQDGCNHSCSYCAIPKARGRSRSVDPREVIRQINIATSSGYNEIVLTGIHLGTYGYDINPNIKLSDLLKTILKETKIKRIRLSSLEVREVEDDLLEIFQDDRICKHLHIPLQSGDDRILRLMKRTYDSRLFSKVIEHILRKLPDIAIGTDVIVGFPGEGEDEFHNTKRLLDVLPVSYMHIFPFSPRPNTIASRMGNSVASATKKERCSILKALDKKKRADYMSRQVGRTIDVLIEERVDGETCRGTASNYLRVLVTSNQPYKGSLVYVRIEDCTDDMLIGVPIP